tara:strand:+ start:37033 stop:37194 length:162 start_codon:yes stop_codon:yes gene_type:complete
MKEDKQIADKKGHLPFIQKMRMLAREADRSIEQYVQQFVDHMDEAISNNESEK